VDTEKLIQEVVRKVVEKLNNGLSTSAAYSAESRMEAGTDSRAGSAIKNDAEKKLVCSISVKHVHLCREHLDILYGKDYEPTILKELYQPNNYAYKETVTLVGPKLNAIQNVRILGPLRDKSQVELAKTDCIILGIDAPVRPSGKLEGTSPIVLIGPKGAVYLSEGVIRANRHIHLSAEDAEYYGIKDNDEVDVRVPGPKGLTFNNVQVRVSKDFKSEMHIDTDDGNAADVVNGSLVEIVNAACITPIGPSTMADISKIPPQIPDNSISGEITDPNMIANISNSFEKGISGGNSDSVSASYERPLTLAKTTKTIITVDDLDGFATSGIKLGPGVILTPLARDEAVVRGIRIFE
jgi:putative phosphotransacetylase